MSFLALKLLLVSIYCLVCAGGDVTSDGPAVNLTHGGILQGISYSVNGRRVDQFLGKFSSTGEAR